MLCSRSTSISNNIALAIAFHNYGMVGTYRAGDRRPSMCQRKDIGQHYSPVL